MAQGGGCHGLWKNRVLVLACHELVVQVAMAVVQAKAAMDVSELVLCVA